MRTRRSRVLRRSLLIAMVLVLAGAGPGWAQGAAVNLIPTGHGYGAANAGRTGRLPPGPSAKHRHAAHRRRHHRRRRSAHALNTIPYHHGYGAANAGAVGRLPSGPLAGRKGMGMTITGRPGFGGIAGPGSAPATGGLAGSSARNVETGGTEGAGSR